MLAAALIASGCGTTEPKGLGLLRGTFGTALADRSAYLGLRLFGIRGNVYGRAWSNLSPALVAGATVSGRYDHPDVTLNIQPDLHFGLVNWRFEGQFENDTLKGSFSFAGTNSQRVELPRVNAIPLGDYSLKITGAVSDSSFGWAMFNYSGGSFRLVQVFTIQDQSFSSMVVFWNRRDLPSPGRYEVSPEGGPAPAIRFTYQTGATPLVRYTVQSGELVIEESDRYLLTGHYLMTAGDSVGRVITLRGVFSSGCASTAC